MNYFKKLYARYGSYFLDFWQYLVVIAIMLLALLFIL